MSENNDVSVEKVLDLEGLKVIKSEILPPEYIGDPETLLLTVIPDTPRPACPDCGSLNVYVNQRRYRQIKDRDSGGRHVVLNARTTVYECNDCHKMFSDTFSMFNPGDRITIRLRNDMGRKALREPFDKIAAEYGVTPKTVKKAFAGFADVLDAEQKKQLRAPRVLGIDEAHLSPDNYKDLGMRGVFIDVENSMLLDITENRSKETVIQWLDTLPHNDELEVVTMDMYDAYRQAVYEVFGKDKVRIVVDHFHVIQDLERQFTAVKNNMTKMLEPGALRTFKHNQSLLQRNIETLSAEDKLTLSRLFAAVPGLNTAYALKESFRSIYKCKTRKEAEEAYANWKKYVPSRKEDPNNTYAPYRSFIFTVEKWKTEIFNFFDCDGVSNASTEMMNGLIKRVNRDGRGYSFKVIRAKMLFGGAGRRSYIPVSKRQKYEPSTPSFGSHNGYGFAVPFTAPPHVEKEEPRFGVSIVMLAAQARAGTLLDAPDWEDIDDE